MSGRPSAVFVGWVVRKLAIPPLISQQVSRELFTSQQDSKGEEGSESLTPYKASPQTRLVRVSYKAEQLPQGDLLKVSSQTGRKKKIQTKFRGRKIDPTS